MGISNVSYIDCPLNRTAAVSLLTRESLQRLKGHSYSYTSERRYAGGVYAALFQSHRAVRVQNDATVDRGTIRWRAWQSAAAVAIRILPAYHLYPGHFRPCKVETMGNTTSRETWHRSKGMVTRKKWPCLRDDGRRVLFLVTSTICRVTQVRPPRISSTNPLPPPDILKPATPIKAI